MLGARLIAYIVVVLPLIIRANAYEYNKPVCRQWSAQPSLMGQRCITDTEVYISKTGVQDAIRKSPSGSIIIGSMPLLIMRSPPT